MAKQPPRKPEPVSSAVILFDTSAVNHSMDDPAEVKTLCLGDILK